MKKHRHRRRRRYHAAWLLAILALVGIGGYVAGIYSAIDENVPYSLVENAISKAQDAHASMQATAEANAAIEHEQYERDILAEVNRHRLEHGIHALEWDTHLQAIARAHSQDMAENDYFEHVNLAGQHPGHRAVAAGYHCANQWWEWGIGENLYFGSRGYQLSTSAATSWMGSPGHRRAMLSPTFHKAAIGTAKGDLSGYGNGYYTTLLLC